MLEIEKNVPLPPSNNGTGLSAVLRSMEIGDSVLVESTKKNRLTAAFAKHAPRKFSQRKQEGGIRVWRKE